MAKTVFDVLIEKLEEHRESHVDFLAGGKASSFDVYREQCGLIRGLDIALRDIQDLARNFMEDRDD